VDLDDDRGGRAGFLVETIDVLSDECMQPAFAFKVRKGKVPDVRLCGPSGTFKPGSPRLYSHLPVGHVVLKGRELLGAGILGPNPVRSPEVGDA
jgi:hypothetical protein